MATGTIKDFSETKGFGFITPDQGDGKDMFFHVSEWQSLGDLPTKGDRVEFTPGVGRDGRPLAQSVRLA